MEIRTVKLSNIKPNPANPRFIRDENYKKLVQSIKDFPEMRNIREIVVNKDMVILGGNMRYRAMQEAKIEEAQVKVVDLSEEKQKEFIIKDNLESGEWEWDKLANEWEQEKLEEWGLETKFNKDKQTSSEAEFEPMYKIEIDCKNEAEQQKIYNELTELGYICKTSTL